MSLSIVDAVLIYVGVPAVVVLLVYGMVYAGSARRGRRYRPGRPFEFRPVWFLSAPDQQATADRSRAAIAAGDAPAALPASGSARPAVGADPAVERAAGAPAPQGATGGASDRW